MSAPDRAPVYITRTSVAMPNAPVDNAGMEKVLGQIGTRPSRARAIILRSNGIKRRFYAIDPTTGRASHTNAQLTAQAIRGLFEDAVALEKLNCLATGTSMPDQLMPNHAVMVHGELGRGTPEVVSTSGICLSGITALKHAWLSVRAGESNYAVATGSEIASAGLHARNYQSESEALIDSLEQNPEIAFDKDFLRWMLSDGAGAVLLRPKPNAQGLSLRVDWIELTSQAHELSACMYQGAVKRDDGSLQGWNTMGQQEWLAQSVLSLKQDVRLLNANIVENTLVIPLRRHIAKHDLKANQIDWFLPHMSSEYFRAPIQNALQAMDFDIPQERWFTNLSSMGNTGSASFYVMLDELMRSGRLQAGQRILAFVPESGRFSSGYIHMTVVNGDTPHA
jgi:3-oxoacyl-[acyl-carrier-protein] synthase-3